MRHLLLLIFLLTGICTFHYGQGKTTTYLYVGTYTDGKSAQGIYSYSFNTKTGRLKLIDNPQSLVNPSYLAVAPNGQYLYACTDTKLPNAGSVSSFHIDSTTGKLTFINKHSSGGDNPVYVAVHQNNRQVVVANYNGGSAAVYTTQANGSLNPAVQIIQFTDSSINKERQEKSHIHSAVFSPQCDYVFLPDLGADKIRAFQFDATNKQPLIAADNLTVKSIAGNGPRHFAFHPNSRFAYCIEELSGTVTAYSYQQGKLESIQQIMANTTKQKVYSSADIHISPDGLFLYASNRGDSENNIAIFSIKPETGNLQLISHQSTLGETPRNFTIDPSGRFLLVANQATNNIVVFKRDEKTGLLKKTGKEIKVPRPSCLQMKTYQQ